MWNRLIIEGNAVYELDDECARRKQKENEERSARSFPSNSRPGPKKGFGR